MRSQSRQLRILINGVHVGNLKKTGNGSLRFYYSPEWLSTPDARPVSL